MALYRPQGYLHINECNEPKWNWNSALINNSKPLPITSHTHTHTPNLTVPRIPSNQVLTRLTLLNFGDYTGTDVSM